jgi:hypothetical protein
MRISGNNFDAYLHKTVKKSVAIMKAVMAHAVCFHACHSLSPLYGLIFMQDEPFSNMFYLQLLHAHLSYSNASFYISATSIHKAEKQNFGLVVGVPGYRSRNPGFDSRRYHIF